MRPRSVKGWEKMRMRQYAASLLGLLIVGGLPLDIFAQEEAAPSPQIEAGQDVIDQILRALYQLPQELGRLVTGLLQQALPNLGIPSSVEGAIGFLGVITLLLVIARFLKRPLWAAIGAGWFLVVLRMVKAVLYVTQCLLTRS